MYRLVALIIFTLDSSLMIRYFESLNIFNQITPNDFPYKFCFWTFENTKYGNINLNLFDYIFFVTFQTTATLVLIHFWKRWVYGESCFQITILTAAAIPLQHFAKCICYRRKSFTHKVAYCTTVARKLYRWGTRSLATQEVEVHDDIILSEVKLQNPVWRPTLPQIEALTGGDTRTVHEDDPLVEAV